MCYHRGTKVRKRTFGFIVDSVFEVEKETNMKLRKMMISAVLGAALVATLTACGKDDKKESTTAAATEAVTEAAAQEDTRFDFIELNGVKVYMRGNYEEINDSLGAESQPVDVIEPCDGGDYIQNLHHYGSVEITSLNDGKIVNIGASNAQPGDLVIAGKINIGDSVDAVKEVLGSTPDREDEYGVSYQIGNTFMTVNMDNGKVSGVMMMNTENTQ